MNRSLAFILAVRYVRGKRSANAVPVLSRISMTAIAVGSAAMIILFSVFNGFEVLVKDLYKAFYPDIRITPASDKFFTLPAAVSDKIAQWPGVTGAAPVIEDYVLIKTDNDVVIATLKGVDNHYFSVNGLKPYIVKGRDTLDAGVLPTSILGMHIASRIGLDINNDFSRLHVQYLNTKAERLGSDPGNAYQSLTLKPDGIFKVQDDFDDKYILAPLSLTQTLFNAAGKISSFELKLAPGINPANIKEQLQQLLGAAYVVETRFEQNHTLYQVLSSEKWATYAILVFVLLIASVNMIGALSLLVLEKRKDMAILSAMGAGRHTIRAVFLYEGILWSVIGGLTGMLLGGAICFAQQRYGLITLNGSFVVNAYPVDIQWQDFVLVILTVIAVGLLAAWYPARKATSGTQSGDAIYSRLR